MKNEPHDQRVCVCASQSDCVLTDGSDELVEAAEGEQRLWKFPQEKLQCSSDHVDLVPLSVLQVQLLLCRNDQIEQTNKKKK